MANRTRTYIAADFDHDKDAVDILYKWKNDGRLDFDFNDAHELTQAQDSSLFCSIKSSLKTRMDASKTFVLIVGNNTDAVTKGGCQYCDSYNSWTYSCARGHSVDYRSYIKYECDKAVEAGINIIVRYKSTVVDRSKCPEAVRYRGFHVAMEYSSGGYYYWNYESVKAAFDRVK